jgi:hypothetical protein
MAGRDACRVDGGCTQRRAKLRQLVQYAEFVEFQGAGWEFGGQNEQEAGRRGKNCDRIGKE